MQKRLLIIEDEHGLRSNIHRFLTTHGYQVAMAPDGGSALRLLESTPFDMVVVDLRLPDIDGTVLTSHIRSIAPSTLIMIISANGDLQNVLSLFRAGVYDFLAKPFLLSFLEQRIRYALNTRYQLRQQMGQRSEFHREEPLEGLLIGQGERVQSLLGELHWAALGAHPVLISGEAGTGKKQVAKLLHQWSGQQQSAMRTLDAAQLTPTQAARGLRAFFKLHTEAGRLSDVQPTTLLLENLQELSSELRCMLNRSVRQAQSQQARTGSRRLIATAVLRAGAANATGALQRQPQFPAESFVFHLPALRERMEDVPFITDLLLTQARQRHGRPVFGVDTQAMRCLLAHAWPGNIRELREAIEQAVTRSDTIHLGVQDLPGYLQHVRATPVERIRLH